MTLRSGWLVLLTCVAGMAPLTCAAEDTAPIVATTQTTQPLALSEISSGFKDPLQIVPSPVAPDTLYVVERRGNVRIIQRGSFLWKKLLNLDDFVSQADGLGLKALVFSPDFETTRHIYISCFDRQGDLVVSRLTVEKDGEADFDSMQVVLKVVQSTASPNGGPIAFGPDGYLYVGVGDGGESSSSAGIPLSTKSVQGKVLRLDVREKKKYDAPSDNPFIKSEDALPEIYASGFRDPMSLSFVSVPGTDVKELIVIDRGEKLGTEFNIVEPGKSYGWSAYEGTKCVRPPCNPESQTEPIATLPASDSTVVAAQVYRGKALPWLTGRLVFATKNPSALSVLDQREGSWTKTSLLTSERAINGLGTDHDGELVITTKDGGVYRVTPR